MSDREITAVSIAVQIDGKSYFVNLPHDRMLIAIKLVSSLSDSGSLSVVRAPDGFKFMSVKDML